MYPLHAHDLKFNVNPLTPSQITYFSGGDEKTLISRSPYKSIISNKMFHVHSKLGIILKSVLNFSWAVYHECERRLWKRKIVNIFLSTFFNICSGCSKEPSHWDGSFEYPQHMFWLRNKKTNFQSCTLIYRPECVGGIEKISPEV